MDTLVLDSPDLAFQLGPVAGTGGLSVRDLQLKSGLLRSSGTASISDSPFSTPFTITNDATIHVTSGSSLTIRGKPATSSVSPLSTFVHEPGGRLQIDGSLKLNHVAFMNHGGDFGGPARITLDGAFLSTLDGVTHSNAAFVVRGWSYLRAPAGYANVNPAGQTIVLQGNSDQAFDTGQMRVDHGFTNYGTIVMEVDPGTRNDWTYLTVYNTTPTSPRLMTNLGAIVTEPGPKADGQREIHGDLINGAGATVTANGNFRVSGATRNEGAMSVAAGRRMSFASLTQAAGTLDVRGTFSAGDFSYTGGVITGGGRFYLAGETNQVLDWGRPGLPAPDVSFVFRGRSHIKSDVPVGYSVVARAEVRSDPYQRITVAPDFTNYGTLSLETAPDMTSSPALLPTLPGSAELQRFINRGTFNVLNDTGRTGVYNFVEGHVLNATTGYVHVAGHLNVYGDFVNEGKVTIAAGKTLRAAVIGDAPQRRGFVQAGGTLEVNGKLSIDDATFTYRGGTITGNAIDLGDGTLINDAPEGSGHFLGTSINLAPAPGRAAVLAGQKISSYPQAAGHVYGPIAWTNEGTIDLAYSSRMTAESAPNASDGRITNDGLIRLTESGGRIAAALVNNGTFVKGRGDAQLEKAIENAGTLTLEREARVTVSGPTTNSGTITLGPAATLTFGGDVTNTGQLVLDPTSSVNLTTAALLHRAPGAAARDEALRHYTDLIRAGRLHSWTGQLKPYTGLAIAAVSDTDLLIKYTYNGDANLDGRVNADDYFRIDQGFLAQSSDPRFAQGDFNYDGRVNADDYFLIDQAFLGQGTPLTGSASEGPLLSSAAVPEPTSLLPLVCLLFGLRRPRNPRRKPLNVH